jgi:adenine-specific DNA methylase
MALSQKHSGAYYTPGDVVQALVRWAVRDESDRLLDPSCGDGNFIAAYQNSVGIEQDAVAASSAIARAPGALVHEGDFFEWASRTQERFECTAGNPPFIRYQTFKGPVRERAFRLCEALGARFSGLSSSWAPFLVAAASLLKPEGRMAFVVPAEIGHAPYAVPLVDYLVANFGVVQIVAIREKLFPNLSEDCWLLYADGFGHRTHEILFSVLDRFYPSKAPPRQAVKVPVTEWRELWNGRLRPYLLSEQVRSLYAEVAKHSDTQRFGDIATIGIGYVSGANDFFHLKPSVASDWKIPSTLLHPTVRNGKALPESALTDAVVKEWQRRDEPVMLLRLPKTGALPSSVQRYLETKEGRVARRAYKCRSREPWYSVPDVQVPDFFLSYMSGKTASLVRNAAGATCTNSVHSVRIKRGAVGVRRLVRMWDLDFLRLSREIEGHPLGGGMLKLEPREAASIVVPGSKLEAGTSGSALADAVLEMQRWRHYADR